VARSAPLIIDTGTRAELIALRERAEANPVDIASLRASIQTPAGKKAHMERMRAQTMAIPTSFTVTFSVEHGHPGGLARHMSMSCRREGRIPHPAGVWMVAQLLGFVGGLESADKVWQEQLQGCEGIAVAVLQLYSTAKAARGPRH
jgi:hypothetical protein